MQQSAASVKRGMRGKEVRATQIDIQMGFILRNGPREPRIVCTIMRFYLRNDASRLLNRRSTNGRRRVECRCERGQCRFTGRSKMKISTKME